MMQRNRSISVVVVLLAVVLAFGQVIPALAEDAPYTASPPDPAGTLPEDEGLISPEEAVASEESLDDPASAGDDPATEAPSGPEPIADGASLPEPGVDNEPIAEDTVAKSGMETAQTPAEPGVEDASDGEGLDPAAVDAVEMNEPATVPTDGDAVPPGETPVQSSLAQPSSEQKIIAQVSTISVANLALSCGGTFSFDVIEGSSGTIGYGIAAVLSDGTTPPVTYGTTNAYDPGTTIALSFPPRDDALAYVAVVVDWATDTPLGETRSEDCNAPPSTLSITSATCDGQLRVMVSDGSIPGDTIHAIFYAYGYDAAGWYEEVYYLTLVQTPGGPGEYIFQFDVEGYPAGLSPLVAHVSAAFYDGDRSVGTVAATELDCGDSGMPDDTGDSPLATIKIVDATCDGSATVVISEGDFVADLMHAELFGLDADGDAIGLWQESYLTYTGPGEYAVQLDLPRFDTDIQPETFVARYSFSNQYSGNIIEASVDVPDCPNPWYIPVEEPDLMTIEVLEFTCSGQATIRVASGEPDGSEIKATLGMLNADSMPIGGSDIEYVVQYTGPGDYEIAFELQAIDIASLPDTFFVGYGFLAHHDGRSIEAGRISDPCKKSDLLPSPDPAPSPDVDPVHDQPGEQVAVTPEPEAPVAVPLVASAPEPVADAPAPMVWETAGVTGLPSTGDGTVTPQGSLTWLLLAGLALASGVLAVGVRGQRE